MLTALFRVFARWRVARIAKRPAADLQRRCLRKLLRRSAGTRFGAEHGFRDIRDVADFQKRVPIRSYDEFWEEYWAPEFPVLRDVTAPGLIRSFALTSGTTTGTTKYIPYTTEISRSSVRGMIDLLCYHVTAHPRSQLLAGSAVMLSGAEDLEALAPGISAGAVSALAAMNTPWLLRRRILPPPDIAAIEDWDAKIASLIGLSATTRVKALGGSPNWLLIFLDQIARGRPTEREGLVRWYPELEVIIHGGVNFAPYRRRFRDLMKGSRAETREVYSASEGFFAIADRGDGEGLRLITDGSVFFEFLPVSDLSAREPRRHWVGTIEPDIEYAVVISSAAGLWAYLLGDTVRFLSVDPPRLVVTGRTSYILSGFGEHLIEEELAEAVSAAADAIGSDVVDYACTARVAPDGEPGGLHEFVVECRPAPTTEAEMRRFAEVLDTRLAELNDDYRELRHNDYNIKPPRIRFAPPDGFVGWMRKHGRLGGQNKVPRIIHDAERFDELVGFMHGFPAAGGR